MTNDDALLGIVAVSLGTWLYYLWSQQSDLAYVPSTDNIPDVTITPGLFPGTATVEETEPIPDRSPRYAPASRYTTSYVGQQNIIRWEGWARTAYKLFDIWHIGIGHKIVAGDGLSPQSNLLDGQVQNLFQNDLSTAEQAVKAYVTAPITQGQFDSLVDFTFNEGSGALAHSTLLSLLNARNYAGAANELRRWIYAHDAQGQAFTVPELIDRREVDLTLFNS